MLTFNHPGIFVSNLEESLGFYRDILGFELVTAWDTAAGGRIAMVKCGDAYLELLAPPGVTRPTEPPTLGPGAGVRHIGFKTDDLDGLAARLDAAGVPFKVRPRVAGSGNGRLMFFYDPDFVEVEAIQRDTVW
jgi:catechol 2,3-dioxygenase-like lactoylglutathione lyase family enzyme